MSDFETEEQERPEYHGKSIKSFVDGSDMLFDHPDDVARRNRYSGSVVTTFVLLVLGVVTSIYILRFNLQDTYGNWLLSYLPDYF